MDQHDPDLPRREQEARAVIEQAKAILVATLGCDPDHAFRLLRDESQHRNVKLRDVAAELVASKVRRPPPSPSSTSTSDPSARRPQPVDEGGELVDGR